MEQAGWGFVQQVTAHHTSVITLICCAGLVFSVRTSRRGVSAVGSVLGAGCLSFSTRGCGLFCREPGLSRGSEAVWGLGPSSLSIIKQCGISALASHEELSVAKARDSTSHSEFQDY